MTESKEHKESKSIHKEILESMSYDAEVEKRIGSRNKTYWVDVYGKHRETGEEIAIEIGSISSYKRIKYFQKRFDIFKHIPLYGKNHIRYMETENGMKTNIEKEKIEG